MPVATTTSAAGPTTITTTVTKFCKFGTWTIIGFIVISTVVTSKFLYLNYLNKKNEEKIYKIAIEIANQLQKEEHLREVEIALEKRKPKERWRTVLFFLPIGQRNHTEILECTNLQETPYQQIAYYFQNSLQSIQICALMFSEFELSNIIRSKRNRGLFVRVITDHDTINETNSSMNNSCRHFQKIGIPVRTKNTHHLMHNKFIIFDEEAVLTGSLNFTKQAIRDGNFENVVITTDQVIVKKYIHQFALLWKQCEEEEI